MIYFEKRALFIHIPRTAGISVSNAVLNSQHREMNVILGMKCGPFWRHSQAHYLQHSIQDFRSIPKICIIRNPWRMIESTYRLFADWGLDPDVKENLYINPAAMLIFKNAATQSFSNFVTDNFGYLEKGFYAHWCCEWGSYRNLDVKAFRFESLQQKWPEISKVLQLPTNAVLPKLNGTSNMTAKNINWTPAAISFIQQRCELDFELFGYPRMP